MTDALSNATAENVPHAGAAGFTEVLRGEFAARVLIGRLCPVYSPRPLVREAGPWKGRANPPCSLHS